MRTLRCVHVSCVGLARTIYVRYIYGNSGREIIKFMSIYGVYIRSCPTLVLCDVRGLQLYTAVAH